MATRNYLIYIILSSLAMSVSIYAQENLVLSSMDSPLAMVGRKILQEAYQRIGIRVDMEVLPAERALYTANNGLFDGVVLRIKEIKKLYPNLRMVPVVVIALEGVVFTKNVTFKVTGWESLKPYTIGILIGSKFAQKGTQGMTVEQVPTYKHLLLKLHQGKTDIAVTARTNGLVEIGKLNIKGIKVLEPPLITTNLYHYLHKKHDKLLPKITLVLQAMVKEGRPKKIWKQVIVEAIGSKFPD